MFGRRVAAVVNVTAGKKYKPSRIAKKIAAAVPGAEIYETKDKREALRAIREIIKSAPDLVVVDGGDGTAQFFVDSFIKLSIDKPKTKFWFAGDRGTVRIVAKSFLRTGDSLESQADRILGKMQNGLTYDTILADTLRINGKHGFLYGSGLPVNLLSKYYEVDREYRGLPRVIEVICAALWDEALSLASFGIKKPKKILTRPVRARIHIPGHEPDRIPFEVGTAIMASTVDQVGFGCRAMPNAMRHPGKFMLRATDLSFWRIFKKVVSIWRGRSIPGIHDAVARKVIIEYLEPTLRTLDGEILTPADDGPHVDTLECGEHPLEVIIG